MNVKLSKTPPFTNPPNVKGKLIIFATKKTKMNTHTLKLILDSMRFEIKDRKSYLESLRKLTTEKRNKATYDSLLQEVSGIDKYLENEQFSLEEKEELEIIKTELTKILTNKNK
jgi:hypothetical protein